MAQLKKKVTLRTKNSESPVEEEPKSKVTLKTKQPEVSPEPVPPTPTQEPIESTGGGGKGKWIAAALAGLLAVGGGGYYLSQQDNDKQNEPQQEVVENRTVNQDETDEVPTMAVSESDGQEGGETQVNETPNVDQPEGGDAAVVPKEETTTPGQKPSDAKASSPAIAQDKSGAETEKQQSGSAAASSAGNAPASKQGTASGSATSTSAASTSSSAKSPTASAATSSNKDVASTGAPAGSIEELALEVIRGKYGNNPDRRRLLGSRYAEIQRKVNEMYRKGLVH